MGLFSRKKDTELDPSTPAPATEPLPATASFPVGIKVWVECEDATVDICFVHGLTGDRDHTWTFKGQAEPWPKTLIPEALAEVAKRRGVQKTPRARILTYGYDAYVVKTEVSSKNGLRDHAKHFLDQIVGDREMIDAVGRPLILVAHSLGGLVSKKAILISRNNPEPHLEDLYKSVKGIAFMGVPHRGSWMANWATFPVSAFGIVKSTNTTILKILKTDDPLLQDTQKEFWSMIRKEREGGRNIGVTCFFEELPLVVVGKRVVSQESATLEGYDEVCIHANHSDMVKFDSKEHDGFKSLFGALVRWGTRSVDLSQVSGCLQSLSFPEMNSRLFDVTVAAKGTLAWLSNHPMHDAWAKNDQGVLWIRGKPGSGKSTLMRRILESTKKMLEDEKEVLILSFFFHGRGTALQRCPLGLYRSLLHQLLDAAPDIMIDLVESYKRNNNTRGECGTAWNWDQNELRDFLEGALREVSRTVSVWLFIDALDEVGEKDAVDLIQMSGSLIKDLPALTKFRFCFASRHYPILTQDFKVNICLEDENLGDISEFVNTNLKIFSTNTIPDLVIERAGGIFMWARLVTERVLKLNREGMDEVEIEAQVQGVTSELDDLYAEVLYRLDDVASVQLFDWVCFARRPLTPEELLSAIGVKIPEPLGESQDSNESSVAGDSSRSHLSRMQRRIGSLSGGLAEFVVTENGDEEPSTVVQFIHQSVQDFYVTKGLALVHDSPPDTTISQQIGKTHDCLLRVCIRYRLPNTTISQQIGEFHDFLSTRTSDNPNTNTDDAWLTRHASVKAKFPLLAYAISSWSHHARGGQERGLSLDYLLEEEYLDWPSAHREQVLSKLWIKTGHNSHACSILHVLAAEGLVGPLRVLIRQARDEGNVFIDVPDRQGKTPLVRAVECGRTEVVKLFVDETIPKKTGDWLRFNSQKTLPSPPQVNFNLIHDERTILSKAVLSRNRAVVRLLINSGKLNVNQHVSEREFAGLTALSHAILAQEYDIMQDLLDCEQVDPNVMRWEDSSLYWAISQKDHIALKALLNSSKVNVNQSTYESFIAAYPPLTYAARKENWHAVKALLKTEKVHAGIKRSRMPRLNFMDPHPSAAYVLIHENQIELLVKLRDAKLDGQAPSEEEKFSRMRGAIEEVLGNPDMPPDEVQKLAEELMGDNVAEARIWGMDFPGRDDIFLY